MNGVDKPTILSNILSLGPLPSIHRDYYHVNGRLTNRAKRSSVLTETLLYPVFSMELETVIDDAR